MTQSVSYALQVHKMAEAPMTSIKVRLTLAGLPGYSSFAGDGLDR